MSPNQLQTEITKALSDLVRLNIQLTSEQSNFSKIEIDLFKNKLLALYDKILKLERSIEDNNFNTEKPAQVESKPARTTLAEIETTPIAVAAQSLEVEIPTKAPEVKEDLAWEAQKELVAKAAPEAYVQMPPKQNLVQKPENEFAAPSRFDRFKSMFVPVSDDQMENAAATTWGQQGQQSNPVYQVPQVNVPEAKVNNIVAPTAAPAGYQGKSA